MLLPSDDQEFEQLLRLYRLAARIRAQHLGRNKDWSNAAAARLIYQWRQLRHRFLDRRLLGEPVWDMLLLLYVHDERERLLRTKDLVVASGTSASTALRLLAQMVRAGLIARTPHASDRRVIEVMLTEQGKAALDAFFSSAAELAQEVIRDGQ
jgi:DNA-binding MarR family transcriptional regulator